MSSLWTTLVLSDPAVGSSFYNAIYALATFPFWRDHFSFPCCIFILLANSFFQLFILTECHMDLSQGDKGAAQPHDLPSLGILSQQCSDQSWWVLETLTCWSLIMVCVIFTWWSWTGELAVKFVLWAVLHSLICHGNRNLNHVFGALLLFSSTCGTWN